MPSAAAPSKGTTASGKAKASSNGHGSDEEARRAAEALRDEAAVGQADDGQLFVMEGGNAVTLGSLIARNVPVQYEFRLDGKSVKGKDMSLIGFAEPDLTLVVPVRAGKVVVDPTFDADGVVKHVTVRAHVKPKMVYDGRSNAGKAALGI